MARMILLDAGVIGLLVSDPSRPSVQEGWVWLRSTLGRADVLLPDVAAYEVRRELNRARATAKLRRLESLRSDLLRAEVNEAAWRQASEFWALVRQQGKPTAEPSALDADAILAGVATTVGTDRDSVQIATTNVRHLA